MSNFAVYLFYLRTFAYFSQIVNLQSVGICSNSTPVICCNNYHAVGNECKECEPGFYGDCMTKCPGGQYGELCLQKCSCNADLCDHVTGCPVATIPAPSAKPGYCPETDNGCCNNYYSDGTECKDCPLGYYHHNCSQTCPHGHYGRSCLSKCETCNISVCHHVYGCDNMTVTKESSADDDAAWELLIIAAVVPLVFIASVLVVVFFRRNRRKTKVYEPKHINNASQRQASRREEQPEQSSMNPPQPSVCQQDNPGATIELYDENPYAQITDTARLLPRTKHTAKEVNIPMAPVLKDGIQAPDPYDILSLKVHGHSDMVFSTQHGDTGWSGANGICPGGSSPSINRRVPPPPPMASAKPGVRRSFLFPGESTDTSSGYVPYNSSRKTNRSSEEEVNELPFPPPPPTATYWESVKPKKGKKPLPPPRKRQTDSPVDRTDDQSESQTENEGIVNLRQQNEMHGETENVTEKTKGSFFTQNKIHTKGPSLKMLLKSDRINRRKSNGKSYNLSGLLDVEEMPPPKFGNDVESPHVSEEQHQSDENQPTVFRKCQTALKTKMNRISALRFANGPLGNLRYSFARPKT